MKQGFSNCESRSKFAFCALCRETLRIPVMPRISLAIVQAAADIAHVIDKLENLVKTFFFFFFFREHLILRTKVDKTELDAD